VNININLTPTLSKGEGVATLRSVNCILKYFLQKYHVRYLTPNPSPKERGWG